ncbi:ABC transporter permease [Mycobacterium marinum]|uniref:ABC transporter permease n=1 Tax=Mycobacterium marinum TaxID=1781 RepID=UPI002358BE77|nr:FtsX-like permease family protein [Mycobacterium marinum]MDC9007258.1 FtsX-like permease family protein [Mycobacterium marinum]
MVTEVPTEPPRTRPNWTLLRKTVRDLRRRPAQSVAIAVIVMLGVLLFIASYDSFRNLTASYNRTYDRLHFADLTASGGDPTQLASAARELAGVENVATRVVRDRPVNIDGTKLIGRVVGLTGGGHGVDDVEIVDGRAPDPDAPAQVAIEKHAAESFHLSPGDRVDVYNGSGWRTAEITGVARSPEYLWPARSRQDILPDPHSFAVLFAPPRLAAQLTGQPGPNQTLVQMAAGATTADRDRVAGLLLSRGALDVQTRDEQPSNAALHEDLNGFSELAVGFPVLFLTAAAIAEYVVVTRVVQAERRIMGAMLAMGARPATVIRHYLGYGVAVATMGALLGVVLGAGATSLVTGLYTAAIGVPDTVVRHHVSTAVLGFALGLATGLVAVLVPAITAARTAPADAMRGQRVLATAMGPLTRLTARWRLPAVIQLAVRSLTRSRGRTVATMVGGVLALILVLASVGMMTSMRAMLDVQFGEVQRQDASVLVAPSAAGPGGLASQLAALPGVSAVEPSTTVAVTVRAGGRTYATTLTGFVPHSSMHGFRGTDGRTLALSENGVLAGAALADKLDVRVGSDLIVIPAGGSPQHAKLAGLVDEPLGTVLYATNSTVAAITGSVVNGYLLRFGADADRAGLRADITSLPGVLAYTDTHALENTVNRYLGLFWAFVGVMLALGGALAFVVIYVTMTVNMAERTTELATLRAAGVSTPRLTATLTLENLLATAAALPFGLAAGTGAAWLFLQSFNSDLFNMQLALGWSTLALAAVAVLAAAAISQLPAIRMVRDVDIARVVRERAQ